MKCTLKAAADGLLLHDFALDALCDIGDVGPSLSTVHRGCSSFRFQHPPKSRPDRSAAAQRLSCSAHLLGLFLQVCASTLAPCWTTLPHRVSASKLPAQLLHGVLTSGPLLFVCDLWVASVPCVCSADFYARCNHILPFENRKMFSESSRRCG